MSRSMLLTRLKRLERTQRRKRPRRAVLVSLYDSEGAGVLLGASCNVGNIERRCGETLVGFINRASRELGSSVLMANYANGLSDNNESKSGATSV